MEPKRYRKWNSTFTVKGRKRLDVPGSLKRIGRRTKAWENVRRQLKREFAAMGVTTCEARFSGCRFDDQLGFAHRMKRRKILGDELRVTALLCNRCHDQIEALSPEGMFDAVTNLIEMRNKASRLSA